MLHLSARMTPATPLCAARPNLFSLSLIHLLISDSESLTVSCISPFRTATFISNPNVIQQTHLVLWRAPNPPISGPDGKLRDLHFHQQHSSIITYFSIHASLSIPLVTFKIVGPRFLEQSSYSSFITLPPASPHSKPLQLHATWPKYNFDSISPLCRKTFCGPLCIQSKV